MAGPKSWAGLVTRLGLAQTACLAVVFFWAGLIAASEGYPQVKVFSIGDGDTITVLGEAGRVKVRLACIDAPELGQGHAGLAAREALQKLLPIGANIYMKQQGFDRYGRQVAEIFLIDNPVPVNLTLVHDGKVFIYRRFWSHCDQKSYNNAEMGARLFRRGVWDSTLNGGLIPPWEFRSKPRSAQH